MTYSLDERGNGEQKELNAFHWVCIIHRLCVALLEYHEDIGEGVVEVKSTGELDKDQEEHAAHHVHHGLLLGIAANPFGPAPRISCSNKVSA